MEAIFLCLIFVCALVHATVLSDPSQATKSYDFVIVGGGTAGNVLANRLTENPKFTVLVIEAGISNEGVLPIAAPFLASTLSSISAVNWNYTTLPQVHLQNRTLKYPRGKVLGGSSSINFMAYNRASDDDYDRWAKLANDDRWSWKRLKPYYLKSEHLVPPADGHNTSGQVDPSVYGYGPVEVSVEGFHRNFDTIVINASKELGNEFAFNLDMQQGTFVGISYGKSTIGHSRRSNSATAYLEPALTRPNLDVLLQTQVTRVIPSGNDKGRPVFRTVEFAQNRTGPRYNITASKEVILSAGTVNTPQILLLSGIGPKEKLETLSIQTHVDIPDVGSHLQDHPIWSSYYLVNSNDTVDAVRRNSTLAAEDLQQWESTGQGPYVDPQSTTLGFVRLPPDSPIFKKHPDPSAGPKSGHYELIFTNGYIPDLAPLPDTGSFMTLRAAVVSPLSKGYISLASTDPFDSPLIDPGFLSSSFDVAVALEAVKGLRRFLNASAWKNYIQEPFGEVSIAQTDEEIIEAIKNTASTIHHPTSTARMSPFGASSGVVDPDLLVKNTSGLRIVDASVFPAITACHPQAAVYIVAERAADLIKELWS